MWGCVLISNPSPCHIILGPNIGQDILTIFKSNLAKNKYEKIKQKSRIYFKNIFQEYISNKFYFFWFSLRERSTNLGGLMELRY